MSSEDLKKYPPTDPELIDKIVNNIKSKGIFDQFRKDCLADVDTKPAYQNLQQRVNGTVTGFLATHKWQHGLNKTQLRESLRRHTVQQAFLEVGVDRIVDQVVNPKIFSVFMPKVEDVVCELLGIEKPKPKPLALNFQKFKKSLEALPSLEPAPAPAAPSPEPIKEKPVQTEKTEDVPIKELSPPDENPPQTSPTPEEEGERAELPKNSDPVSPGGSISEVLNNGDDSNTIDEMPLLAASLDSDSNRGGSPLMDGAPQNSDIKIGAISELSNSHSLLRTRPPLEYDSSTNNLSSLKSEEKMSPSKKFDNFSNLGEKLKQADVNLRETSVTKKEDLMEESSDLTKSSENDTESSELKIDLPSESNMSSVDAFRHEPTKMDVINERLFSEDSQSSPHSLKNKSRQAESRDDRSRSHKHEKKSSGSMFKDIKSTKADKKDESLDGIKETMKKDQNKGTYSSKHHESKSRSKEDYKGKSKNTNDKDRHRDDKHKSTKDKSLSSDKHEKSDAAKERKDRRDRSENEDEKKNEDPKLADSNRHSEKKKKEDDKSRHHSKDTKDSKSHRKVDDHNRNDSKEKNKSTEKEKNGEDQRKSDHDKSKKDSGGKSSRSKSDDRKHQDDKKKDDDKKYNDDDKKKTPRKRKSGRCDDGEVKSKNSRRSSDRDSNGNAGGGSSKSKSSNSSSHNGRKSSKSDKGRSHTKSKEPSNPSDALGEDCEKNLSTEVDEADEVDMILMEINNSIQNENQRLNISEVLNEPTVKKPKIARNFHEIKKIMQARKDIDRRISNDLKSLSSSRSENSVEEKVASDVVSRDIDTELHIRSHCNEGYNEDLQNTVPDQDVSGVTVPNVAEGNVDYVDDVPSATSTEIELKDCSIVVTDVIKGQLKNSSISSLNSKRIVLEDDAVKDITTYSPNSSDGVLNESTVDVASTENPSKLRALVDESCSSSKVLSSLLTVENKSSITDSKVSPENGIHHAVCEGDTLSPSVLTACNEIKKSVEEIGIKGLESSYMADGENEVRVEVPDPESCTVRVLSQHGLAEECDINELKVAETTKVSRVRAGPSCSSDIVQPDDESESGSSIQTEPKKVPGKASSAVIKTREIRSKSCTDLSKTTPVSAHSKRSNAGTLMYTILEGINEKVPPNKQSVSVNRSTKRKGTKLETSKNFESVSEPEVRSPVVNSKSSQASDNESLMTEKPVKPCSADDGSDVSNKENDETNVTCKTRSQMMDVGPNEAKNIETRTTRRKNLTNDLSEDLNKSVDNNTITKGRVSLKRKNNLDEPGCFSEEMPGKVDIDLESKKLCTSISNRHSTRKGVIPLYLRNAELEKGSGVNISADSCATDSLLDKTKFCEETCKSMESLHMDKENITVPPTACDNTTSVEQCLVSLSQRRKSCPDIYETRDVENRKSASSDKGPASVQQKKSSTIKLDMKTSEDTMLGSNPLKGSVAQTGNHGCSNRRSGRRFGNAGTNDPLPIKDNENGNRISRNSRKLSLGGDKLPRKSEDEGFSSKKRRKLDSPRKTPVCSSVGLVNPSLRSEEQIIILPDIIQHPSTITINIDASINKITEDEPPQVTLYFDDSAIATFNSEADASKPSTQTLSMSEDLQLKEHANTESIHQSEPSRVSNLYSDEGASQIEENVEVEEPSCSLVEEQRSRGEYSHDVTLCHTDSFLEDSCSSEFKGFSPEKPVQDYVEKEYKGFTDDEIQEATVQLHLLKQYIANHLRSSTNANNLKNRIDGPPRAKKTRVASEGVVSSNISEESTSSPATRRHLRKRNFSLNSSPEKDKKEVLGGQCKAESKDSGLCESPEQPSFFSDMCRNDAVLESGENTVRTRKMANVPPKSTPAIQRPLRKDKSSGTPNNKNVTKTRNPQRYSTVDLYKPRPMVGRDARTSKTSDIPLPTSRGRPKRST